MGRQMRKTSPPDSSGSDTDSDGVGNNADTDDDNDQISDIVELETGTDPLLSDSDGAGYSDLVDLGQQNKARWHRGTPSGFEKSPAAQYRISPFSEVMAVPDAKLMVLWGDPKKKGTQTRTDIQILRGR